MTPLQADLRLAAGRLVLLVYDACRVEHFSSCFGSISIVIFVVEINDFSNALLDQSLGAFIAGKERNINGGTGKIALFGIKDRIEFSMSDKCILRVEHSACSCPRKVLIVTADREAVVAYG